MSGPTPRDSAEPMIKDRVIQSLLERVRAFEKRSYQICLCLHPRKKKRESSEINTVDTVEAGMFEKSHLVVFLYLHVYIEVPDAHTPCPQGF